MKKDFLKNIPRMDPSMLAKPISQVYEEINTECNNFLKTQRGIQYLLMKYPKLSPEQAIKEFRISAIIADSYDPTCQSEW
jgi:hypothetical protein